MTINRIDDGALKCETFDGLRLGFPTGISTRRFSSADTVSIRNSEGIIIDASGTATSWPIEKFIEYEGDMVAVGPWLENSRPFDMAPVYITMISRLLPAVRAIKAAGYPLKGLYSRAIRWLPDGGVLIYPPKLAAWVLELNPDNESSQAREQWVHPDHQGEAAWSFTLLHELVHLWLGESGVSGAIADSTIERFCNDVAGRILLDSGELNELDEGAGDAEGFISSISEFAERRAFGLGVLAGL